MLEQIAFIGGGNMASALIGGLINDGLDPGRIQVSDINQERLDYLHEQFHVHTRADNQSILAHSQIVVLAVKPQNMLQICEEISPYLPSEIIVLSIAAGVPTHLIDQHLGKHVLVRAMPNTPALVGSGATALYATAMCNEQHKSLAESLMRAVGLTIWVDDEKLMDAVTALSGSGPAYFFQLMEVMTEQGQAMGLSPQQAQLLTVQTALGAAKLALESSDGPKELRNRVTSPGGTTEAAMKVFEQNDIKKIIAQALHAARDRSEELANLLGVSNE